MIDKINPNNVHTAFTMYKILSLWFSWLIQKLIGREINFSCGFINFLICKQISSFLLRRNNWQTYIKTFLEKSEIVIKQRNWVCGTDWNFLIPMSLQHRSLKIWYFKFRLLDLTESQRSGCKDISWK